MIEVNEPYGFIYITTNMINGKRYIGQKKFKKDWKIYLGSGKLLKRAIKKYEKENFIRDIVAIAYSEDELNKLESEWIKNYNASQNDNYYNIAEGSVGGNTHLGKTQEEIKEMYEKIINNRSYKHTKESKMKISISHKGVKLSEEHKKSLSEAHKGINTWNLLSDINKSKLSNFRSQRMKNNNPMARKVICLEDITKVFNTMSECANYYRIKVNGICKACKSKEHTYKKLHFMYYHEYMKQEQLLVRNEILRQVI